MALQKPRKDLLDSLHQCGTCCVSEACPTLLGSCTLLLPLLPSATSHTPVPLAVREAAATLCRPWRPLQPEPSLGSCPLGLGHSQVMTKQDSTLDVPAPKCLCIVLSFPIAKLDGVPSRLAILDQGKMIFLVPFLSSTREMFVVCPKEQLQSGVGGSRRDVPCLSRVPRRPKGSALRLSLHQALPVLLQTLPPPPPLSLRGHMAPGRRAGQPSLKAPLEGQVPFQRLTCPCLRCLTLSPSRRTPSRQAWASFSPSASGAAF